MALYKGRGFDVYVLTPLKDAGGVVTGHSWTLRTNGKLQTDSEMAHSLARDLERQKIPWQIRNRQGVVAQSTP